MRLCACSVRVGAVSRKGVWREKRHVTLDRGGIGGYDWLFSDVTDCESSQLGAITRCLVTPSASPPQRRRPLPFVPSVCPASALGLCVANFISLQKLLLGLVCPLFVVAVALFVLGYQKGSTNSRHRSVFHSATVIQSRYSLHDRADGSTVAFS